MNAVIFIETRELKEAKEKHKEFYLSGWDFISVCSWRNEHLFGGEKLIIPDINSIFDYNKLMVSSNFWSNYLKYNRVLISQMDAGLLRTGIDKFLYWDYVGAPWSFQEFGGNGGLSLRSPKVMYEICSHWVYDPANGNEDIYFCNIMKQEGYKLAPRNVCNEFSVESEFILGTLGYHFGEDSKRYLTENQKNVILNQYNYEKVDW